jgi:DeoR/GlpR family transcriptional regulator of sugar metabolism
MLQIERRQMIIQYLEEHEIATVEELSKLLNVAPMTIRRDLQYLEDNDIATRTFGGAILKSKLIAEIPYENKSLSNIDEKKRIAEYAASLVQNGQVVILDAGTTNMEIAKLLIKKQNLIIVTTDLKIAVYISSTTDFNVLCTGGNVQNATGSCLGSNAVDFLKGINADICFIGSSSIDVEHGITTPSLQKSDIKKQMIKCSEHKILVADSSKFGKKGFIKVCDLNQFEKIVTDKNLNEHTNVEIKNKNINLILV